MARYIRHSSKKILRNNCSSKGTYENTRFKSVFQKVWQKWFYPKWRQNIMLSILNRKNYKVSKSLP